MMLSAAAGQYVNPAQAAAMQTAAGTRSTAAYERGMLGMVSGIPLFGTAASLLYESERGRDLDRQAALEEARGGNMSRSLMAGALLGRSRNYGDDMYAEAKFGLLDQGANFGRGGANVGDGFNFSRITARNGGNIGGASSYASALLQFAGQAQNGLLGQLVGGTLDLNSPELGAMFVDRAASRGDFGALGIAMRGPGVGQGAFGVAADTALGNLNIQLGQMGMGFVGSQASYMGATGASASDRAGLIRSYVPGYADQQMREIQTQFAREGDPLRRAQLFAEQMRVAAQREEMLTSATRMVYGEEQSYAQIGIGGSNLSIQHAMYGTSEGAVSAGYGGLQAGTLGMAGIYGRMSRESRFSPEERARYALQQQQSLFEGTFGIARQEGGFRYGMASGRLGVASSLVGMESSEASLFGGIGDIYSSRMAGAGITGQQAGLVRGQLAGDFGPITMQERLSLQERLNTLMRQEAEQREGAVRGLSQMQIALAQTAGGIAGSQQSRAFLFGAGGVEGFGYASRTSGMAAAEGQAAQDRVRMLRARGVSDDNPEMQSAVLAAEMAQTRAAESEMGATQVPFSLGLRQSESRERFALSALSMFPGQYGSMRALLSNQMNTQEEKGREITSRRDAHAAQYGGKLPDHLAFSYEQQLQQVALEQAGTFNQLSYGWESRLQSQMLGTPGGMSFITPSLSFRAAVGNGVRNPHMGATGEDVPMFLRQAMLASSIAGATGTPEGFAVTAMTGASGMGGGGAHLGHAVRSALEGVKIVLEIPIPGGGHQTVVGTTVRSNSQDTSPGAMVEQSRRNMTAPHQ
jgi:hypothetical protein